MACGLFTRSNSIVNSAIYFVRTISFKVIIYVTPETAGDRVWLYAMHIVTVSGMQRCNINPIADYENSTLCLHNVKIQNSPPFRSMDLLVAIVLFPHWTILQIQFRQLRSTRAWDITLFDKSSNASAKCCI